MWKCFQPKFCQAYKCHIATNEVNEKRKQLRILIVYEQHIYRWLKKQQMI